MHTNLESRHMLWWFPTTAVLTAKTIKVRVLKDMGTHVAMNTSLFTLSMPLLQPFSGSVLYGVLILWMCHHSVLCNGMILYVKPTESLDTTVCDTNLCCSLDTYAKQREEYFKSNVTFVLLPGNHTLSDPLVVSNVTNLTFRGVDSAYILGVAPSVKIICR